MENLDFVLIYINKILFISYTDPMNNFHDLHTSDKLEERMCHDFLILLMDQLFGQHDLIIINESTETDRNHQLIKNSWKLIKQYYDLPDRVKYIKRIVRQTFVHIVDYLNQKYQFVHPLKFELKRRDYYDKIKKKKQTDYWSEFSLI